MSTGREHKLSIAEPNPGCSLDYIGKKVKVLFLDQERKSKAVICLIKDIGTTEDYYNFANVLFNKTSIGSLVFEEIYPLIMFEGPYWSADLALNNFLLANAVISYAKKTCPPESKELAAQIDITFNKIKNYIEVYKYLGKTIHGFETPARIEKRNAIIAKFHLQDVAYEKEMMLAIENLALAHDNDKKSCELVLLACKQKFAIANAARAKKTFPESKPLTVTPVKKEIAKLSVNPTSQPSWTFRVVGTRNTAVLLHNLFGAERYQIANNQPNPQDKIEIRIDPP